MNFNTTLQTLIALFLIYFLCSTLVSILFEWYASLANKKGLFLFQSIDKLLNDTINNNYAALLYSHFNINKFKKSNQHYPSYISSDAFADTLIDIIGRQSEKVNFTQELDQDLNLIDNTLTEDRITEPFERFKAGVDAMKYSTHKSIFRSFYEKSNNYEELKLKISNWFNDYMTTTSYWYKAKTKSTLLIISLVTCLALNIDSINIIKVLMQDDVLRNNLVASAETLYNQYTADSSLNIIVIKKDSVKVSQQDDSVYTNQFAKKLLLKSKLDSMYYASVKNQLKIIEENKIPIGYHKNLFDINIFEKSTLWWLLGIFISTILLSFGAPFWFDVLSQLFKFKKSI